MNRRISDADKEKCLPVIQRLMDLRHLALCEGLLGLEAETGRMNLDPLLAIGIKLTVEGVDPETVQGILENILGAERYEGYELLKGKIIIEGVLSIQAGENPGIMELRLTSHLGLAYAAKTAFLSPERKEEVCEALYKSLNIQESPAEGKAFEGMIHNLGNHDMGWVFFDVDMDTFISALKICGYETVRKVMGSVSAQMMFTMFAGMAATPDDLRESLEAQSRILAVHKNMTVSGEG
jgi:hypothetical protein